MKEKIKCIYCIIDFILDKIVYIGATTDFKHRKNKHFCEKTSPIDKYMFEQGRENFFMAILEELCDDISKEEILKKEDEYILKYDTIELGLNKQRSGLIFKNNKKEYNREYKREYQREYYKTEKGKESIKKACRNWYIKKKQENR